MKVSIIVSNEDPAGLNIKEKLIAQKGFAETGNSMFGNKVFHKHYEDLDQDVKIYTIDEETPMHDDIDKKTGSDFLIYATRHRSKSGIPSLSVHCTGNWDIAEFGGKDDYLCVSPQNFLKEGLIYLENNYQKHALLKDFDIIQECTHHGPYLEKPLFFIEIGSTENEWVIDEAGVFIAETIDYLLKNFKEIDDRSYKTAVGIGGPHSTSNFKKIILGDDVAISHVCPKYMTDKLTQKKILHAIEQSTQKADMIILDWKGLGQAKQNIKTFLEDIDIPVKRTKNF